ncbi:MAG: class I SAM-dependent methyltransferase [Acidimicrobiia bacterium]|nr:class I SAM-dependent methyltransferase [Acidimicrobiia bacterium]
MHEVITKCRSCLHEQLSLVLDMGSMPLVDALVPADRRSELEATHPLTVVFCESCALVQIRESLPASELFGPEYHYFSSYADELVAHAQRNARALIERYSLDEASLVVEPASNDGYLLQHFASAGISVLGIDPAHGPAARARELGIETIGGYMTYELSESLRDAGRAADLVVANNVLAHVSDQNDFVAAVANLLADSGAVAMEVPYVRDLVERCEYDTIYHEHHCYFSASSVQHLFARHGLHLNDVEHLAIHGGSLRLHASFSPGQSDRLQAMLDVESDLGMSDHAYYADFAKMAELHRNEVRSLLGSLKAEGKTIAGYGAAAKGTVLLNFAGIGSETIDFIVDRNPAKQGKFLPGVDIPILDPSAILERRPDYLLILPWNFTAEILAQQRQYLDEGGQAIVTNPAITIL